MKVQERDSELDRLRRVVQTAVEHGLHDGHVQIAENKPTLPDHEAYFEVRQLAVLLGRATGQSRSQHSDSAACSPRS